MGKLKSTVRVAILRDALSHKYKHDPELNTFYNNTNHNCRDIFLVYVGHEAPVAFLCQAVSNHPGEKYGDTLAKGQFQLKAFVPARKFHGRIHGIVGAVDLEGQTVDATSMQNDGGKASGRWLVHDSFMPDKARDATYMWSGGCIMLRPADLEEFGSLLDSAGVTSGDLIDASLYEYSEPEMVDLRRKYGLQ